MVHYTISDWHITKLMFTSEHVIIFDHSGTYILIWKVFFLEKEKRKSKIQEWYCMYWLVQQSSVKISDVKFLNIKGTTISKNPILLNCSSLFPCENIELGGIDLVPVTPMKTFAAACSSAKFKVNGVVNPPMPPAC